MACETTREIWQAADDQLADSVGQREKAKIDHEAAKADRTAAEQALVDAQAAEAAAASALTDANNQVEEDAGRASAAYQNHMDCLTGTGGIDPIAARGQRR